MLRKINQLPQQPKLPSSPFVRFFKIGIAIFIIGVVLEVLVVNRLATYGDKISQLERQKTELELENADLKDKLFNKVSLDFISKKSSSLGFEKIKNVEYINAN